MSKKKAKKKLIVVRGIDLTFDMDVLDDIEFLDVLYELESGGKVPPVKKVLVMAFGQGQYQKIAAALRDGNGRIRATDASEFLVEAFGQVKAKK